jgi:hypothetical protein
MMTGSSIARNLAQNATEQPRASACHARFLGANLRKEKPKGEA